MFSGVVLIDDRGFFVGLDFGRFVDECPGLVVFVLPH